MATDDRPVFLAGEDRLDKPELADAPFEGVELLLADASGVGWIRTEKIDRDLLDRECGAESDAHAMRSPTPSERGVSSPSGCARPPANENEIDVLKPLAPTKLTNR